MRKALGYLLCLVLLMVSQVAHADVVDDEAATMAGRIGFAVTYTVERGLTNESGYVELPAGVIHLRNAYATVEYERWAGAHELAHIYLWSLGTTDEQLTNQIATCFGTRLHAYHLWGDCARLRTVLRLVAGLEPVDSGIR